MKYYSTVGDSEFEYRFERSGKTLRAHGPDGESVIDLSMIGDGTAFSILVDGKSHDVIVERADGAMVVQFRGERIVVDVLDDRERAAAAVQGAGGGGPQQVCAAMPGVVVELMVAEGDRVERGQTLVVLEAMKMQNPLQAEGDGVVTKVCAAVGEAVAAGAVLVEVGDE